MTTPPQQLKQLRLARNKSQAEVAEAMNRSQASMVRYERGDLTYAQLEDLANYFGLTVALRPLDSSDLEAALVTGRAKGLDDAQMASLLHAAATAPDWALETALHLLRQAANERSNVKSA